MTWQRNATSSSSAGPKQFQKIILLKQPIDLPGPERRPIAFVRYRLVACRVRQVFCDVSLFSLISFLCETFQTKKWISPQFPYLWQMKSAFRLCHSPHTAKVFFLPKENCCAPELLRACNFAQNGLVKVNSRSCPDSRVSACGVYCCIAASVRRPCVSQTYHKLGFNGWSAGIIWMDFLCFGEGEGPCRWIIAWRKIWQWQQKSQKYSTRLLDGYATFQIPIPKSVLPTLTPPISARKKLIRRNPPFAKKKKKKKKYRKLLFLWGFSCEICLQPNRKHLSMCLGRPLVSPQVLLLSACFLVTLKKQLTVSSPRTNPGWRQF